MGEFLGALVAIPSIRRLRIVGPYDRNMAWSITATALLLLRVAWSGFLVETC